MNAVLLLLLLLPSLGYSRVIVDEPEYMVVESTKCPLDVDYPKCGPVKVEDQCKKDTDCEGRRKCCTSGCKKLCLMTLKVKSGRCPSYEHSLCNSEQPIPHECHRDDQCPGSHKCCYQCRRQCTLILPFEPTNGFE
ncbi:PREDICTED: whey acidic protein-like [Nanorana parkeri]|uniref:whey acidic protein-like n=1 Tax=Nanorana parkeri TaxID=125878 RepID=UPI0008543092|nr:PREDICTED: whey acidic protein-like [Nanorana parkeri]